MDGHRSRDAVLVRAKRSLRGKICSCHKRNFVSNCDKGSEMANVESKRHFKAELKTIKANWEPKDFI